MCERVSVCILSLSLYLPNPSLLRSVFTYVCICIYAYPLLCPCERKSEATDSETHSRRKRDGKRKLFCAFTYHYYSMYLYMLSEFACMLVCMCTRIVYAILRPFCSRSLSFARSHSNMCTLLSLYLLFDFQLKIIFRRYILCAVCKHTKYWLRMCAALCHMRSVCCVRLNRFKLPVSLEHLY